METAMKEKKSQEGSYFPRVQHSVIMYRQVQNISETCLLNVFCQSWMFVCMVVFLGENCVITVL